MWGRCVDCVDGTQKEHDNKNSETLSRIIFGGSIPLLILCISNLQYKQVTFACFKHLYFV